MSFVEKYPRHAPLNANTSFVVSYDFLDPECPPVPHERNQVIPHLLSVPLQFSPALLLAVDTPHRAAHVLYRTRQRREYVPSAEIHLCGRTLVREYINQRLDRLQHRLRARASRHEQTEEERQDSAIRIEQRRVLRERRERANALDTHRIVRAARFAQRDQCLHLRFLRCLVHVTSKKKNILARRKSLTIFPGQTVPTPHNTPTATSHTAPRALPGEASAGLPAPARAVHTAAHTRWPTCMSAAAAAGAAASARNALERHSKAAMWIAPSAEVVGGWGDGAEKESSVGWMSVRRGSRSVGRNEGAFGAGVLFCSGTSSSAMGSSGVSSMALSSASPPIKASSSISSSTLGPRSGSGSVAHTPVSISNASCTVRRLVSTRSRPSSSSDLWSGRGGCFGFLSPPSGFSD
jgi:hypothetical protein